MLEFLRPLRQLRRILHHSGHQLLEGLGVLRRHHRPAGLLLQLPPGVAGDAAAPPGHLSVFLQALGLLRPGDVVGKDGELLALLHARLFHSSVSSFRIRMASRRWWTHSSEQPFFR